LAPFHVSPSSGAPFPFSGASSFLWIFLSPVDQHEGQPWFFTCEPEVFTAVALSTLDKSFLFFSLKPSQFVPPVGCVKWIAPYLELSCIMVIGPPADPFFSRIQHLFSLRAYDSRPRSSFCPAEALAPGSGDFPTFCVSLFHSSPSFSQSFMFFFFCLFESSPLIVYLPAPPHIPEGSYFAACNVLQLLLAFLLITPPDLFSPNSLHEAALKILYAVPFCPSFP